jgi:hypothetical protein
MAERLSPADTGVALLANPAVTLARAFTKTFTGIAPQSVTGFVLPRLFFGTWFGVNKPHRK